LLALLAVTPGLGAQAPVTDPTRLEARITQLERSIAGSASLVQMHQTLQSLEREVRELRGEIELQAHELQQLKARQRELYLDVDRRLSELAGSRTGQPMEAPPAPPSEPPMVVEAPRSTGPAPAPRVAPPAAPGDPAEEAARYDAAFDLLKAGRYAEATRAFGDFLDRYPGGRYADNAQYWLGETAYVNRDFDKALAEFQRVEDDYPSSPKVADALLKIGYIEYEQEQWPRARQTLERLVEQYPATTAAQLARQRLRRMSGEGR
jgi:tol-pal system protein YbgF